MKKITIASSLVLLLLKTGASNAESFDVNEIYGPWCQTESSTKLDGEREEEKAQFTFTKDNKLNFKDSLFNTTQSFKLEKGKIKTEDGGFYNVISVNDKELVLKYANYIFKYLKKGQCA